MQLAQDNCVGKFEGKGGGRVFGNTKDDLEDLKGQRG